MADQQNVSLTEACKRFDEAIRAIEKYQYKAEKEPNALLDPTLDKYNGIYYVNPCMRHKKGARNIAKGLKEFYEQKAGKEAKANTSACTAIVSMPKDFMQAHYNLSDREYVLMEKYVQEEKLSSDELAEIKKIKKKMVHIEWTPEEMQEIHMYFKAMEKAYCITAGIKGCETKLDENGKLVDDYSNSDILWSISHLSESWPHWHFGFLPLSYIRESEKGEYEKYENAKEERNKKVGELVSKGFSKNEAAKMVPQIKQPRVLYGNKNRKIEVNEKAIGCSVKKYSKGYLHTLNRKLEERMLEQGIKTKLANGKGSKFKVSDKNKEERFEESTNAKMIEALTRRCNELETILSEKETLLEEKEALLEEKEIELNEKLEHIRSLREVISDLKNKLKELTQTALSFVPDVVAAFIKGWAEAVSDQKRKEVAKLAQAEATARTAELASPLGALVERAEALAKEEEVVSGVNMAQFNRTDQRLGFAKGRIRKAAERKGLLEILEANPQVMDTALEEWFNKEKCIKVIEKMSEVDAKLYMDQNFRAERTLEFALQELGLEEERDEEELE